MFYKTVQTLYCNYMYKINSNWVWTTEKKANRDLYSVGFVSWRTTFCIAKDHDCEIMNRDAVPFVWWRHCIIYNLPFYLLSIIVFSNYVRSGYM